MVGEALDRDQRHWLLRKVHQGYVNLKDTVAYKSQVSQLSKQKQSQPKPAWSSHQFSREACAEWAYHTYAAVGQAAYDVASQDDLVNDAIDLDTVRSCLFARVAPDPVPFRFYFTRPTPRQLTTPLSSPNGGLQSRLKRQSRSQVAQQALRSPPTGPANGP